MVISLEIQLCFNEANILCTEALVKNLNMDILLVYLACAWSAQNNTPLAYVATWNTFWNVNNSCVI